MDAERREPVVASITIPLQADYAVLAPPAPLSPPPLVIAFHGWGQSCRGFIRRLAPLAKRGYLVAAPQAPHPFYVSAEPKKVGFTWLTIYERDRAVAECLAYAQALFDRLRDDHPFDDRRVYLLGFSQGASVAHRVAVSGAVPVAAVVGWAADLPPDAAEKLPARPPYPVLLVHAGDDPVVPPAKSDEAAATLTAHGYPVARIGYEGGHVVTAGALGQVADWLDGLPV